MQINLTFFIQLINFGISYWFLNKFLFKPVLQYIRNKKQKEDRIIKDIAQRNNTLVELEHKKDQNLFDFKREIKSKYEVHEAEAPKVEHQVPVKINKDEAERLIKVAKNILIKKVPHVD